METRTQNFVFAALLIGAFLMAFLIFWPFLTPIILAVVLSVVFRPLHRGVSRIVATKDGKVNERSTWASLVTLLIIAIVVVTPLTFIAFRVYSETQHIYVSLTDEVERTKIVDSLNAVVNTISHKFFDIAPTYNFDSFNVTTYVHSFFKWALSNIDTIFESTTSIALGLFIMLFALFYLLRDGTALRRNFIAFSPLPDHYEDQILNKLEVAIHSVVTGNLIISLLQGCLTGIGFLLFGVPNPFLWGTVAMFAALIPGVGTSLVLVPAIIYLFVTAENHLLAFGLLIWGMLAVGLIDNFLSGILMNRKVKIHPLLILLSVLGGLSFFGLVGFILGPLTVAFLSSLIEIYRKNRIIVS